MEAKSAEATYLGKLPVTMEDGDVVGVAIQGSIVAVAYARGVRLFQVEVLGSEIAANS